MHTIQLAVILVTLAIPHLLAASDPSQQPAPAGGGATRPAFEGPEQALPSIVANDNRTAAGILINDVLSLELRAEAGLWRPGSHSGPAITVQAFGHGSAPLSVPAPLIRVPEGTEIAARVRNTLSDPLRIHGLCERGGAACPPLDVPGGETREVRFKSGPAGTYQYWATTTGMPQRFRAADDTQLSGAFVVDPRGAPADADRVFVITEWSSLTQAQLKDVVKQDDPGAAFLKLRPDVLFLINGRMWPHTERLRYEQFERVRWRVVNLSTQVHPMHLHGFYFDVDSQGDGMRDSTFAPGQRPHVVTQIMQPGSTMGMTWKPERAGNWLFHCHVMTHVSPTLHVDGSPKPHDGHGHEHDQSAGMTGMVLGITVTGPTETGDALPDAATRTPHRLTLLMQSEAGRFDGAPAYGFVLGDDPRAARGEVPVPGPTLVLKRGEPVEITLVNRLPEGTGIHWHGMELDSYYDGVHGWSGSVQRVTPLIEPGRSFVVRFTPPRTGTFMYHTHLHDRVQLTSGLYGAMLVVEPGEAFDPTTDHVVVIGRGGPQRDAPVVINTERDPQFVWKAGARHRIRLINITPDDIFSVSLQTGDAPVTWQPMTKDGAPLPPDRSARGPARQIIGVGETYDFEYQAPPGRQTVWLEVRTPGGRWHAQGRVIIR